MGWRIELPPGKTKKLYIEEIIKCSRKRLEKGLGEKYDCNAPENINYVYYFAHVNMAFEFYFMRLRSLAEEWAELSPNKQWIRLIQLCNWSCHASNSKKFCRRRERDTGELCKTDKNGNCLLFGHYTVVDGQLLNEIKCLVDKLVEEIICYYSRASKKYQKQIENKENRSPRRVELQSNSKRQVATKTLSTVSISDNETTALNKARKEGYGKPSRTSFYPLDNCRRFHNLTPSNNSAIPKSSNNSLDSRNASAIIGGGRYINTVRGDQPVYWRPGTRPERQLLRTSFYPLDNGEQFPYLPLANRSCINTSQHSMHPPYRGENRWYPNDFVARPSKNYAPTPKSFFQPSIICDRELERRKDNLITHEFKHKKAGKKKNVEVKLGVQKKNEKGHLGYLDNCHFNEHRLFKTQEKGNRTKENDPSKSHPNAVMRTETKNQRNETNIIQATSSVLKRDKIGESDSSNREFQTVIPKASLCNTNSTDIANKQVENILPHVNKFNGHAADITKTLNAVLDVKSKDQSNLSRSSERHEIDINVNNVDVPRLHVYSSPRIRRNKSKPDNEVHHGISGNHKQQGETSLNMNRRAEIKGGECNGELDMRQVDALADDLQQLKIVEPEKQAVNRFPRNPHFVLRNLSDRMTKGTIKESLKKRDVKAHRVCIVKRYDQSPASKQRVRVERLAIVELSRKIKKKEKTIKKVLEEPIFVKNRKMFTQEWAAYMESWDIVLSTE